MAASDMRTRSRWRRFAFALWLMCVVGSVGGVVWAHWLMAKGEPPARGWVPVTDLSAIERRARVTFPDDATLVEARYLRNLLAPHLSVRLRMSHQSAEAWFTGPPFDGDVSRTERYLDYLYAPPEAFPDWRLEGIEAFMASTRLISENLHHHWALADLSDPDEATLYYQWTVY